MSTQKLDINSDGIRVLNAKTTAISRASCNKGDMAWDSSYACVCVNGKYLETGGIEVVVSASSGGIETIKLPASGVS